MSQKNLGPWPSPLDEVREAGLTGSIAWNPGAIADHSFEAKDITVTGAILGDWALTSFSLDVGDLALDGQVTAADTVTAVLMNNTSGEINLAAGTVYAKVIPRT